ncbi:MAG: RNA polymerase sporulation sigma factor SigH [Actinobacteria bacterium]|nr:RNA polymerase sporulation sigma factor SigH [Actinomycetota bacterium]
MARSSASSVSSIYEHYEALDDDKLIRLSRMGNMQAQATLLSKYKYLVKLKVKSYFLIGADKEDLIQEGMIGLYKAIQDFRDDKDTSFKAFAELCITRQIITAIKGATRQKHLPLNQYVSLSKSLDHEDDSNSSLDDIISESYICDPIDLLITHEEIGDIKYCFNELLSKLEATVLSLYMDGNTYHDIAGKMDRQVKSIDNALQRVKRKLDTYLRRADEA